MHQPTRIGIVGLGHVFEWQAKALELVSGIEVSGGTDTDPAKAGNLSKGTFYPSLDELLATDVDAVLVSTPPATHHDIATQVLRSGRHVLLEKPATLDLGHLSSLYALARDLERRLVVAFHASFAADVLWVVQRLKHGSLAVHGQIDSVRSCFCDPYLTTRGIAPEHAALGGSWIDSGINALSVLASLVRDPVLTEARATVVPQFGPLDVAALADFEFSDTVTGRRGRASIETNWALGINRKTTSLRFTDGTELLLDHSGQQVVETSPSGAGCVLAEFSDGPPRLVTHYMGVFQNFLQHLARGSDNEEFARLTHRLLLQARDEAVRLGVT